MKVKNLTKSQAVIGLKKVMDPELGLDVYALGLIYDIKIKDDKSIQIKMTLTSPMCPFGPQMISDVKNRLKEQGFKNPEVEFVFDPPWAPNEEVKMLLGLI